MTLQAAFSDLQMRLHELSEALALVRASAVEDRPAAVDSVLVDRYGDAADELRGWLQEALDAALVGEEASRTPSDVRAGLALLHCHEQCDRISHRLLLDLLGYRQVAELAQVGRERGSEWRAWSIGVRRALEWCQAPLFETHQALLAGWREFVDRAPAAPPSVVQRSWEGGPS